MENLKDWEKDIVNKYPEMFKDYNFRGSGLESPNGWKDLVEEMCQKLSEIDSSIRIVYMKAKFGQLVADVHLDKEDTSKSIDEVLGWAFEKSAEVCHYCGENGRLTRGPIDGWIKVECHYCNPEDMGFVPKGKRIQDGKHATFLWDAGYSGEGQ